MGHNKLKICMVTTFYPPYYTGGCGIHVYNLANLLAQRGHYVEIIHDLYSYFLKEQKKRKDNFEKHRENPSDKEQSWLAVSSGKLHYRIIQFSQLIKSSLFLITNLTITTSH